MLWLPPHASRKALARLKRKRRRRRLARLLLFGLLLFVLNRAAPPPAHDLESQISYETGQHQFEFINWLSLGISGELERRINPLPLPEESGQQRALVDAYLHTQNEISRLRYEINKLYAAAPPIPENLKSLEATLERLKERQAVLRPYIETVFARQIEAVLRDEGFALAGQVVPPVAFRLVEPPTVLVVSPRDRIERQTSRLLQPGLETATRNTIEEILYQRGDVAGYVTNIGGLGSYPTMVINHGWLPGLIDIIGHEWTHNYLYIFPSNIAWGYQRYPRLTVINETAASLVGQEISRKVITRFYPDWAEALPPLDEAGRPAPAEPSEFHLAMRRIRQETDRLLAAGDIEAAEAYMEKERQALVEQGYNLRRLNQAYFAFHGSYALSPGSVDPTGQQIRALRANSDSLKQFLMQVGWLNSYADFEQWLDEANVPPAETLLSREPAN